MDQQLVDNPIRIRSGAPLRGGTRTARGLMGGAKQKRKTARRKLRQKAQQHLIEARRFQRLALVGPSYHQEAMMVAAAAHMKPARAA